jgi:hypothetical protein
MSRDEIADFGLRIAEWIGTFLGSWAHPANPQSAIDNPQLAGWRRRRLM